MFGESIQLQAATIESSRERGARSRAPALQLERLFGNTMVVNGRTWPVLHVEPRRYRFRFLNGCNARFLILKLSTSPKTQRPAVPAAQFWQIGSEGGFLPAAVPLNSLLMGNAERADVIVDFSRFRPGTELYLLNEGPDEPFGGGRFAPADPSTTGQVMKFVVGELTSVDTTLPPSQLRLPDFVDLGPADHVRRLALIELDSDVLEGVGPGIGETRRHRPRWQCRSIWLGRSHHREPGA